MAEIDDLIEDLIYQYEVFADGLLVDDPAEVLNYGHDAVEQL